MMRLLRVVLANHRSRFVTFGEDLDRRTRAGEFGKWPWQRDHGLWPWQRRRRRGDR